MELRRATRDDVPALARQLKEVAGEGRWIATQADATLEELTDRFAAGIDASHVVIVAEVDGQLAGSASLHPSGPPGVAGVGMALSAEHRGQGHGRRLLEALMEAAREDESIHKVELEVFTDNAAAIALYESFGFEREGLRRDHYRRLDGSLRSALLMAWFPRR